MKALAFVAIVILVALAMYFVVRAASLAYHNYVSNKKWRVHIEEVPDSTEVWLVKGQTADFMGRARRSSDTYQDTLFEIEGKAEEAMYERNAAHRIAQRINK